VCPLSLRPLRLNKLDRDGTCTSLVLATWLSRAFTSSVCTITDGMRYGSQDPI
jgi:hypothetical protein